MGPLTARQKDLIFRAVNERRSQLAKDLHPLPGDIKLESEYNEIIEIIGPAGEDLVQTVDPNIRIFSSKMIKGGENDHGKPTAFH